MSNLFDSLHKILDQAHRGTITAAQQETIRGTLQFTLNHPQWSDRIPPMSAKKIAQSLVQYAFWDLIEDLGEEKSKEIFKSFLGLGSRRLLDLAPYEQWSQLSDHHFLKQQAQQEVLKKIESGNLEFWDRYKDSAALLPTISAMDAEQSATLLGNILWHAPAQNPNSPKSIPQDILDALVPKAKQSVAFLPELWNPEVNASGQIPPRALDAPWIHKAIELADTPMFLSILKLFPVDVKNFEYAASGYSLADSALQFCSLPILQELQKIDPFCALTPRVHWNVYKKKFGTVKEPSVKLLNSSTVEPSVHVPILLHLKLFDKNNKGYDWHNWQQIEQLGANEPKKYATASDFFNGFMAIIEQSLSPALEKHPIYAQYFQEQVIQTLLPLDSKTGVYVPSFAKKTAALVTQTLALIDLKPQETNSFQWLRATPKKSTLLNQALPLLEPFRPAPTQLSLDFGDPMILAPAEEPIPQEGTPTAKPRAQKRS